MAKTKTALPTQGKKSGDVKAPFSLDAIEVTQGKNTFYLFQAPASQLFASLSINRKVENKDEGYQRSLSISRVDSITRYLMQGHVLPGSIIVSFDEAEFDNATKKLSVPAGSDVGWVIDGQHRLAGADLAARKGHDVNLPVVAFVGLGEREQIEMFVTINREGKNVPTSLYLDLLKMLPNKRPADAAKERSADLANELKRDENSPFFNRIVVTTAPRAGELSMTNFVRKIAPHVTPDRGILGPYTEKEQKAVIANYFAGLEQIFPREFNSPSSIFFKTIGFGALWNLFPTFFSLTLKEHNGFEVHNVASVFKRIEGFTFEGWREYGTGSAAEILAGNDIKTSLLLAFEGPSKSGSLRV